MPLPATTPWPRSGCQTSHRTRTTGPALCRAPTPRSPYTAAPATCVFRIGAFWAWCKAQLPKGPNDKRLTFGSHGQNPKKKLKGPKVGFAHVRKGDQAQKSPPRRCAPAPRLCHTSEPAARPARAAPGSGRRAAAAAARCRGSGAPTTGQSAARSRRSSRPGSPRRSPRPSSGPGRGGRRAPRRPGTRTGSSRGSRRGCPSPPASRCPRPRENTARGGPTALSHFKRCRIRSKMEPSRRGRHRANLRFSANLQGGGVFSQPQFDFLLDGGHGNTNVATNPSEKTMQPQKRLPSVRGPLLGIEVGFR